MTEGVLPGLYLGNFIDAKDLDQLGRNKITHIISIHESPQPLLQDITYLRIPVADTPEVPIKKHFKECINFIHCCRLNGGNCLVHCFAGISRSTTIVTAYVMTVTGLGWRDVLEAIKATRPIANPNPGFRQQLEEFGWGSSQKHVYPLSRPTACWLHMWLFSGAALVPQRCRLSPPRLLGPPPHVADGHPDPECQICLCFGEEDPGPTEHPEEWLIMAYVQVQLRPGNSSCTLSASTQRPDGCLHPKRATSSSCTR
uniref:Dual specificity protein phosphatase 15 n=1 Tax=Cercocebus atys TaxID=9531 RepID=A0A2K5NAM8_CERAT